MDREHQAAARQLFSTADALGIQLPKPVVDAREVVEKIRAGAATMAAGQSRTGVADAVGDALARGANPAKDRAVAEAITRDVITSQAVIDHVEDAAFDRLWETCGEQRDEIVAGLRAPFGTAAAVLTAAHQRIGDKDLSADSEQILRLGGDVATVWSDAVQATKTIDSVVAAWVALGMFLHAANADRRWANLRLVSPDAATWDELGLSDRAITAWDALRAGVPLTMPTFAEFNERQAAIVEQRAEAQAALADDQLRYQTGRPPRSRAIRIGG
jgi:hypothetical protein